MDTITNMKIKRHQELVDILKYNPDKVLREKQIGNWIITIEMAGNNTSKFCKIYNAITLEEHFRYYQTISCVSENADAYIKAFYERCENRIFNDVCDLASKWNDLEHKNEKQEMINTLVINHMEPIDMLQNMSISELKELMDYYKEPY